MYTEIVQYSNDPAAVTKLVHPDGVTEYRLTRNVVHEKDNEDNDVIQGEEVYFEIAAGNEQPSAEDVEKNFDAYWNSGMQWTTDDDASKSLEERVQRIENDHSITFSSISELERTIEILLKGELPDETV